MTYALREAREYAAGPLPAQTAWRIALHAPITPGFRGPSFHDPFHGACTHSATLPENLTTGVGGWPVAASRSVGRVLCRVSLASVDTCRAAFDPVFTISVLLISS
jgi:hypothetical protein